MTEESTESNDRRHNGERTDGGSHTPFAPHHVETRERLRAVETKHDSLHEKLDGISEDVAEVAEAVDHLDTNTVEADYESTIEENERIVDILKWLTVCATVLATIAAGLSSMVVLL